MHISFAFFSLAFYTACVRDALCSGPRLKHRPSDNDTSSKPEGVWTVLDQNAPKHKHKHVPSCILARLRVSIVIPVQHPTGEVTNKTIVVPENASVSGTCGSTQQRITLMWNNTAESGKLVKTGQLTFLFVKKNSKSPIFLSGVWASMDLFLEDGVLNLLNDGNPSQNLMLAAPDLHIWETPARFAYVCHHQSFIPLQATTLPTQLGINDSNIVMVDPVYENEAYLVFHDLAVEAFRHNRFAKHFTHLKYDCRKKWNYDYIPYLVGTALVALVVFDILVFIFRKQLGCDSILSEEDEIEGVDDDDDDDVEPLIVTEDSEIDNAGNGSPSSRRS
ncbi:hypothetical protein TCAL_06870 [Tigriopus californicus]|uniref:Uncharacterized protein n=1 Tax=Tigriopus californicus TaxID=6832 RepID=A0A553NBT2_TIGCA|nr:uncharacterized protein LOC131887703 [Tigriopus californicus]XP_059092335.1 uncharacterized protein LOC131887703 [Tigriopus californicus]TRY62901.1 hypothetical protein TCAL_06870 [Tigriopus californicus]|eukprot:TCALIF_06870-PA protein Name:"Protein of unknown function" AED:0.25 eAED:0.25 QI:198/1/1/1/1/1/4/102/332